MLYVTSSSEAAEEAVDCAWRSVAILISLVVVDRLSEALLIVSAAWRTWPMMALRRLTMSCMALMADLILAVVLQANGQVAIGNLPGGFQCIERNDDDAVQEEDPAKRSVRTVDDRDVAAWWARLNIR